MADAIDPQSFLYVTHFASESIDAAVMQDVIRTQNRVVNNSVPGRSQKRVLYCTQKKGHNPKIMTVDLLNPNKITENFVVRLIVCFC